MNKQELINKTGDVEYEPVVISCAGGHGGSGGSGYAIGGAVEAESSVNWYDYDKRQAIALPPVGVECEYISSFLGTKKHYNGTCKVIAYYQNKVWIDVVGYNEFVIHLDVIKFHPLDWNRKADEERRDLTVNAAFKSLTIANDDFAYKICQDLYDNGYLKNKAAS